MSYHSEYMRERYRRVRSEIEQLLGGCCAQCGTVSSLQIDHIDRTKKTMRVNRMTSVKRERLLKELENCQLLCDSCHRLKTINDLGNKVAKGAHGTLSSIRWV